MKYRVKRIFKTLLPVAVIFVSLAIFPSRPNAVVQVGNSSAAPVPLIEKGHAVEWWFVFKFNSAAFPGCRGAATRQCQFGGEVQSYRVFGQQYAFASSESPSLKQGSDCVGDTTADPIGATFDEIYSNSFYYVIWNDQFYDDPRIKGCTKECGAPWGHSKGLVAWNDGGEGLVLQVSTPSWWRPATRKGNHMPTNLERANWADKAIRVFREQTGCDHEESLSDFLCDLMH